MRRKIIARESTGRRIIEQSRLRLLCVGLFFALCFISIGVRMVEVGVINSRHAPTVVVSDPEEGASEEISLQAPGSGLQRGDIVDRNGTLLATSLMTSSIFVNPGEMKDPENASARLGQALGIDGKQLLVRLKSGKTFVWVKRNLTPREAQIANNLGIPGLHFTQEEKRVYPYGHLFSHTLGYVGLDNKGQAGIEKQFDKRLRDTALNGEPLALALDARLQGIMYEEVNKAVDEFQAIGATGVIMDVKSGEIVSMLSLPDFNPSKSGKADDSSRFNRATLGAYEMGSTFKSFTMAMALEYGTASMKSMYDASNSFKIGSFTISDSHPAHRWLMVPEIYAHSSNVGTARMALQVGIKRQREFLEKIGMMKPVEIELPEKAAPLYPADWKEINSVTISYGHGISVSPLHLVRGIAALVDGGRLPRLTLVKDGNKGRAPGERIVSEQTSQNIRRLMRLVVDHGTGSKGDVPGYRVAGKTGTAEKVSGGVYEANAKLASFIATFPVDDPQYIVLVMIDEPKGNKSTYQFATGGWIAAPVVASVIARMGPLLGMKPVFDAPGDDAEKFWVDGSKPKEKPVAMPASGKKYVHAASY